MTSSSPSAAAAVWQTQLDGLPDPKRGKVRDIYDLGEHLLLVACDRISAFDWVLSTPIPGKGKVLNQLTNYWLEAMSVRTIVGVSCF